jgi:hypothetical protein
MATEPAPTVQRLSPLAEFSATNSTLGLPSPPPDPPEE